MVQTASNPLFYENKQWRGTKDDYLPGKYNLNRENNHEQRYDINYPFLWCHSIWWVMAQNCWLILQGKSKIIYFLSSHFDHWFGHKVSVHVTNLQCGETSEQQIYHFHSLKILNNFKYISGKLKWDDFTQSRVTSILQRQCRHVHIHKISHRV